MTAESILKEGLRYDSGGNPLEVTIPYKKFIDFIETYGLDLTDQEVADIHQAQADIAAGKKENFVGIEELEKELGL